MSRDDPPFPLPDDPDRYYPTDIVLPTCRHCGCQRFDLVRGRHFSDDDGFFRRLRCRSCRRGVVVHYRYDVPEIGNGENEPE